MRAGSSHNTPPFPNILISSTSTNIYIYIYTYIQMYIRANSSARRAPCERCSKPLCGLETVTNSFRERLRGASAAARVVCASGVYMANAYAALKRIELVVEVVVRVLSLTRTPRNNKSRAFQRAEDNPHKLQDKTHQPRAAATSRRRLEVNWLGLGRRGPGWLELGRGTRPLRSLRGAYAELTRISPGIFRFCVHFGCLFVALVNELRSTRAMPCYISIQQCYLILEQSWADHATDGSRSHVPRKAF